MLSSDAVKTNDEGYYHEVLEVLFFEVFNKPFKERGKKVPVSIKDYPFLNGGLFETVAVMLKLLLTPKC